MGYWNHIYIIVLHRIATYYLLKHIVTRSMLYIWDMKIVLFKQMLTEKYDTTLKLLMVRYIFSMKYGIENTYHPMNWICNTDLKRCKWNSKGYCRSEIGMEFWVSGLFIHIKTSYNSCLAKCEWCRTSESLSKKHCLAIGHWYHFHIPHGHSNPGNCEYSESLTTTR